MKFRMIGLDSYCDLDAIIEAVGESHRPYQNIQRSEEDSSFSCHVKDTVCKDCFCNVHCREQDREKLQAR